jgi:recombination protein RecT
MSTAIAKKQESPFEHALTDKSMSDYLAKVMGEKKTQFVSNMIAMVNNNPSLQNMPPNELINAGLQATSMDLPLEKSLGNAYVVPYKGHPQFQVGKDGYIQLAMRTEKYKTINVCTIMNVNELQNKAFLHGEPFAIVQVKTERIQKGHNKPIGYCATFVTVWGFEKSLFMTSKEMQAFCGKYSESYKNDKYGKSLWNTDFDIMAEKTVLKNLLKHYGIKSVEMNKAIISDQAVIRDFDKQTMDYIDNPQSQVQDVQAEVVESNIQQQQVQQPQNPNEPTDAEKRKVFNYIQSNDFENATKEVNILKAKYVSFDFKKMNEVLQNAKDKFRQEQAESQAQAQAAQVEDPF